MNVLIGVDYLTQKLEIWEIWSLNWNVFQLLWRLALRANRTSKLRELITLTQDYRFGQIWSQNWNMHNVFWYSELVEYINIYKLFGIQNLTQNSRFGQIWSHVSYYDLIFMKFGIQSRQNTIILNTPFGIGDLVPNFGPTQWKYLANLGSLALRTNRIFELIFIAWTLGNFILKMKYAILLFIRLGIEIAVKSQRTVWKLWI